MGTKMDTRENLNMATSNQVPQLAEIVTRFAGHMALRLVHDHLLRMDLTKYDNIIRSRVRQIDLKIKEIKRVSLQLRGRLMCFGFGHRSRLLWFPSCSLSSSLKP